MIRAIGLAVLVAFSAAGTAMAAPPTDPETRRLIDIQQLDQRVADVAWRLRRAGGGYCAQTGFDIGVTFHSRQSYVGAYETAAIARFALDRGPALLAVAQQGPAARAGILVDDVVIAIDGAAPMTDKPTESGIARVSAQAIDAARDGSVTLDILRNGNALRFAIAAERVCTSRVTMVPSDQYVAQADGAIVQISSALVRYAIDDDWLATIVAHELAHNFLEHRKRLNAAGISRGVFGGFGRSGTLSRAAEIEADRVGLRVMAAAGFRPNAAVAFWQAYRRDLGQGIFRSGTHPSERARIAALRAELVAIEEGGSANAAEGARNSPLQDRVGSSPNALTAPDD